MFKHINATILAFSILAAGCAKKEEAPPASPPPAAAKPVEKIVEKPAAPPAEAPSTDPVDVYVSALKQTPRCVKAEDGIAAKDYSACLKPLWDAAKSIDDPAIEDFAAKTAKSKELKAKLAQQLALTLSDKDRTVVFYTVFQNQTRLDATPTTVARLEQLMDDEHAGTAEWAAIARFVKRDKADTATQEKAKAVLKEHKTSVVRGVACQYFGNDTWKDDRTVFELLKGYADNKAEDKHVRSCAVSGMGYVGDDKDVKTIAGFLPDKDVQYSAFYALQAAMHTKASFDALIKFVADHAKKPGTLDFGALIILVPFDTYLPLFDVAKAKKAMADIVATPGQEQFVVDQAKKNLEQLDAVKK